MTKGPDVLLGGVKGVVAFINLNYAGRMIYPQVTQQRISDWMSGKRLPGEAKTRREVFPPAEIGGHWSKKKIHGWAEQYLARKPGQEELPMASDDETDWSQEQKKEKTLLVRLEREDREKASSSKWMLRQEHDDSLREIGGQLFPRLDLLIEKTLIDGLQAESDKGLITQDVVDRARKRHEEANDGFKRECAEKGIENEASGHEQPSDGVIFSPEAVA